MTSTSRIPQHLAPYINNVPNDSLILLTNTLSNSTNWLVVRYLCGALSNDASNLGRSLSQVESGNPTAADAQDRQDVGVILVSWMRDFDFWKAETRRTGGLDLASLSQKKKFIYIDGLSSSMPTVSTSPATQIRDTHVLKQPFPSVRTTLPARGPPPPVQTPVQAASATQSTLPATKLAINLPSTDLKNVRAAIESAIASLNTSSTLLILDAPDMILALRSSTSCASSSSLSSALQSMILSLRLNSRVHATVLNLSSDVVPLPSARPEQHIPSQLETDSQAFLVGMAHSADLVISARGLDTGAAGDVGGVLRVTKGGAYEDENEGFKEWKEQELLYLVKTDGSAKVWERSAGVG
ncbi:uncharacterized protein PV09_05419 [Verruconis gallopava]|uniref:Elongator complex protein 5 n=1 Tax=Verruconis gallopava TaxID=253628 RepID=A0A0D2A8V8_9PEZI|nr:uncharacterized protein PV09_05419 [Verruconis gallopava]KIW03193.1 hypothetical protein PV09_05419 [Verruconis gallopava]